MKRFHFPRPVGILLAVAFWIGVWALLASKVNDVFLLPSPSQTLKALLVLTGEKNFWLSAGVSLLRILRGILWGTAVGIALAILTASFRPLMTLASPLLAIIKATPIASVIILLLLWMKRDDLPVLVTALIVLPTVWANVNTGIKSVDRELWEVSRVYRFPPHQKLFRLYVPTVLPYFLAACRSSLGMAWKAGIAAEVLCTPKVSIGKELLDAKIYMQNEQMFAWTLVVILLSLLVEKGLMELLRRLTKRVLRSKKGGVSDVAL